MSNGTPRPPDGQLEFALLVGIDWASNKHEACVIDPTGKVHSRDQLEQSTESIDAWVNDLLAKADGKPIAIALEQTKGALIYALMHREDVYLFPINPQQLASYRKSFSNTNAKDDVWEAFLIARFLFERRRELRMWAPDDEPTRLVSQLAEARRATVDERTRLGLQLLDLLRSYHLAVLRITSNKLYESEALLAVISKWPDPAELKRVHPKTLTAVLKEHGSRHNVEELVNKLRSAPLHCRDKPINHVSSLKAETLAKQIQLLNKAIRQYDEELKQAVERHPDYGLFAPIRGAGAALIPRLIAALGSDRDRFASSEEFANYSGTTPVCQQSGKMRHVTRRRACNKFLKQTFHELAASTIRWTPWAKAYYQLNKQRGLKHHAILRKLARCWIRILWRVWISRIPYDDARYQAVLLNKHKELQTLMTPA